jgi:hypothetical protein
LRYAAGTSSQLVVLCTAPAIAFIYNKSGVRVANN